MFAFFYFQVNLMVLFNNMGGVMNFVAYTFVRRYNASGGRQDKGTGRREKERGSISTSVSTSVSTLQSKYE